MEMERILVLHHGADEGAKYEYTWVNSMEEVDALIQDNACYPLFHVYAAFRVNPFSDLLNPGGKPTCSPGA